MKNQSEKIKDAGQQDLPAIESLLAGIVPHLAELEGNADVAVYLEEIRAAIAALPLGQQRVIAGPKRYDPRWNEPEPGQ